MLVYTVYKYNISYIIIIIIILLLLLLACVLHPPHRAAKPAAGRPTPHHECECGNLLPYTQRTCFRTKGILPECVVIRTHIYRLYMSTTTQSQQLPGLAHPTTYQVVAEEPILPPLKSIVISQHPRSSHIGSYILRSGPERSGGGSQPPGHFPSFVRTRNLH